MMRIARSHQADIEAGMTAGVYGLDRAVFLCQLRELDSPEQVITDQHQYSLGHLYGLIEKLRRISRADEQSTFEERYLVLQSSLECSGGRFWGQTQGADWESISRAVDTRESSLPVLPTQSVGQRRVDALASICLDSLTGTRSSGEENRAVMVAEVFVDA
jgi:hypothetical protein